MKKYILTIVFAATQMVAVAQTVNVHFKNGQTINYPSSNVDYVDFSAKAPDPTLNTGAAVDLGLSVYWASCNLGAEKPEEYGDYYAWGETKTKSKYSESTYSYYDKNTEQYTNIGNDISGTQYDAATVNLGSDWRMPTKDEIQELINKCTWEWTQVSGINGYKVTGANGNSIFLPTAGASIGDVVSSQGSYGYYMSSTVSPYNQKLVYFLEATSTSTPHVTYGGGIEKYFGLPIRPVTTNPNAGGTPVDHSQDYLVTDKVTASFLGGAYSSINGKIQGGSQLNVKFSNGSNESVTLTKIQLNDASNGTEGNNLLETEVEVAAGDSKTYTVTVGWAGITTPVIRFTYRYNKKNYTAEATWNF